MRWHDTLCDGSECVQCVHLACHPTRSTLIYFCFCIFLIWWTRELARHVDEATVTIADYTVRAVAGRMWT